MLKADEERRCGKRKGGLSSQQACIMCMEDDSDNAFCRLFNVGKSKASDVDNMKANIRPDSEIATDASNSYTLAARDLKLRHLMSKEGADGFLSSVNSLHSMIKERMRAMRGVDIKHLNRYYAVFMSLWMNMKETNIMKASMHIIGQALPYSTIHRLKTAGIFSPVNLSFAV